MSGTTRERHFPVTQRRRPGREKTGTPAQARCPASCRPGAGALSSVTAEGKGPAFSPREPVLGGRRAVCGRCVSARVVRPELAGPAGDAARRGGRPRAGGQRVGRRRRPREGAPWPPLLTVAAWGRDRLGEAFPGLRRNRAGAVWLVCKPPFSAVSVSRHGIG